MSPRRISLPLPFRLGRVNCYLLAAGDGFVLVDTGGSNARPELLRELEAAGCRPGLLRLVFLTHGDFDHIGNAAHLRQEFGCPIAMHPDDAGMAECGDMFVNRQPPNALVRKLLPLFTSFGSGERFSPDVLATDGADLCAYGIEARVVSIPGHSRGSIGLLTVDSDFFCGDLLENRRSPGLNSLMDDPAAGRASLEKLASLRIANIYPGHGAPFASGSLEGNS